MQQKLNPKFADTLAGTIADERRHVGFGENRIATLIRGQADKKAEVQRLQREMSGHMLAAFASSFKKAEAAFKESRKLIEPTQPANFHGTDLATAGLEDIHGALSNTVLHEFKSRLGRVGIEYQSPV
jgi:hypothetical protein